MVQAEDGRKYHHNEHHLRVCPAPGYDSLNGELPLGVDKTVVQDKEPARDAEFDHPRLPHDYVAWSPGPTQEQPMHPESAVENFTEEPYVTRSERQVVAPNRLDL